jgi:hypothetical protein
MINENGYLVENNRVFLLSKNVNIFPCARRGLYNRSDLAEYYDPEARLNTERTNRISSAINGFTDSFIITEDFVDNGTFVFVLAGYRIEIKNFNISDVASVFSAPVNKIYAHLSLHTNIELDVADYFTEILYRQSIASTQTNYLDVTYENAEKTIKEDFFVGISFTKEPVDDYIGTDKLPSRNLLLFSKDADDSWQIAQTSLLPKLEHGETKDSIKIFGDLNVDDNIAANKIVIADDGEISTPQLRVNRITSNEGSITVDNKKLIINKSLEMTAKADAESPAKATIEQAVIGDLTVKVDTNLKNSTGKITAKEVVAEKITQNGKVIPAIDLVQNGEVYQLQITLDASKK